MKAQMKFLREVSVSSGDLIIKDPVKAAKKGIKLLNAINVKINYNGYKQIKIILKQKLDAERLQKKLRFHHQSKDRKATLGYSISFSDTKIPIPSDGVIFQMDNNLTHPIIDKIISLDLHIRPDQVKKAVAGQYKTLLQLTIMEME